MEFLGFRPLDGESISKLSDIANAVKVARLIKVSVPWTGNQFLNDKLDEMFKDAQVEGSFRPLDGESISKRGERKPV